MIKTIAIIVISVTFFGVLFFILVRNALKRKLDILIEEEKRRKDTDEKNYQQIKNYTRSFNIF